MTNPIDIVMSRVKWQEVERPEASSGLYSTHEGILEFAGHVFRCYRLNNGERVLDARDVEAYFGISHGDTQPPSDKQLRTVTNAEASSTTPEASRSFRETEKASSTPQVYYLKTVSGGDPTS